jgi:glucose/mannose-6-phosphate isomerase
MDKLIGNFPAQVLEAVKLAEKIKLSKRDSEIHNVLVCGLGGSGIAGNLAYDLTAGQITVPIVVNKGYELPGFADEHTLLILCSYSGNTEETLSCAAQAVERGLRPVCVASGGKLKELAEKHHFDFIQVPGGSPPRTTLGYGSTILLHILDQFALIDLTVSEEMVTVSEFLTGEQASIKSDTAALAKRLKGKTVIVYCESRIESAALRLKQQINENAKSTCWINVIPELNHNELVGWKFKNDTIAALFLRTNYENNRNELRFDFIRPIVAEYVHSVEEVKAKGSTLLEQYFYLIHFGDWLSYYMSIEQGQDPIEVHVIDKLKAHLSAIG